MFENHLDEDSTQSEDVAPSRRSGRHSAKVNQDLPLNYPVLDKIIKNMIGHKEAWPFRLPVSKTEVSFRICTVLM